MKKIILVIIGMLMLASCATGSHVNTNCVKADCEIAAVHHHVY